MKLMWRDAIATMLVAATGMVVLAVTLGWDWPLVGSYRAATGVLGIVGLAACTIGGTPVGRRFRETFGGLAATGGGIAAILVVVGLVTGARTWFLALAVTIGVLWLATTVAHAFGISGIPTPAQPRPRTTPPRQTRAKVGAGA